MARLDPEQLALALERSLGAPVQRRETHISIVFLAGDRAYKLKKPITLPFVDYGTPARRRIMCEHELELNRRLAPDLYLAVRSVIPTDDGVALSDAGDPTAIDYVVEMRRYDEHETLAATLSRGELRQEDVTPVAHALAAFHAACPRRAARGARMAEIELTQNLQELRELAELHGERERVDAIARFVTAFAAARSRELDARSERGMIRECHGDLRAEHIVLRPELSIVDCVEFDLALRTLDVADDLAFLVMDLTALGGRRFAEQLVHDYRAAGGDPGEDAILALFATHRALVRAKVLLVRAAQYPAQSSEHGHAGALARELLAVAEGFAWRARLPLVLVICGLPASGKTELAATLARESGLVRLSSDLMRKRLAGIAPTARATPAHYHDEFNRLTYGALGSEAANAARTEGGAIVDATFRHRPDRDAFARAFGDAAPLLFVECVAPPDVLAARASAREHDPDAVSDATRAVVLREQATWEPLHEVPGERHLSLRTDRPPGAIVADLHALLDRRL